MKSVAVIVLSWENSGSTIKCVESVIAASLQLQEYRCNIVLVDNGSSQATVAELTAWHENVDSPLVSVILSKENNGFSKGMNIGINYSKRKLDPDYFWLLNNDLYVEDRSLEALLECAQRQTDVVIWGPTVISQKNARIECAGGCRYYPPIGFSREAYRGLTLEQLRDRQDPRIDYIYGAAMFVEANFLYATHGLEESYFLYFEELELSKRLLPNERLAWCRASVVYHLGGGSSTVKGVEYKKAKQASISAFLYTGRYYPYYLPSVMIARFCGLLLRGLFRFNPKLSVAVIEAILIYFRQSGK